MFGKDGVHLKGLRVGVTGVLYKQLKIRQKSGKLLLASVDEFKTSKVQQDLPKLTCHACLQTCLTDAYIGLHSIQACQSCEIMWQRDVNASKNIFKISRQVIGGHGRPREFTREQ
ncbi:uncharacterized protein BX663DRAFT_511783 [Cokeromyces recurvatus]|uniref:uncharacterized protein n=1 Tax=Cokeromyces recurvatus TaxID=90255 RepID=UPI00222006FF|nr:uncharacterized protein BX663DRAFT_511783 [Cokeromyces recurvatus]KAI7902109.1 hypothetical protein BX663DRAFT_511783 [Cokeromyces recurvatus]